ncbi:MAG: rod shape-determining protein RodA [Alphaproteobacteria bacterium]
MPREVFIESGGLGPAALSWPEKIWHFNWSVIALLVAIASIGFLTLYSAAGGSLEPWAVRQMVRFGIGLSILVVVGAIDIRIWFRLAYVMYGIAFAMLAAVEVVGTGAMGAERWLSLGVIQVQPSEVMKVSLVLALARYYHGQMPDQVTRPLALAVPLVMALVPAALLMRQPDLGTAMMLIMATAAMMFLAGVRPWFFIVSIALAAGAAPVAWRFMRDYQRHRILTFLDPESDPLGKGYHILQSKIALGSGGIFGKGFMEGSQSYLNYLPEKQTDFIFTMFAEEFGMVGGIVLVLLYLLLLVAGLGISLKSRSQFGRMLGYGLTTLFFLYVFINIAMVMGIVPVVGVPLPLLSYGGTAMLTLMFSFGLLMSVSVHRDVRIGRAGMLDVI